MDKIYNSIMEDKELKVVSFDIFDTLLFRCVERPNQVFEIMYEKHPEYFPLFINKDDWRELRCASEHYAKEKIKEKYGYGEVQFEDIYKELPDSISGRERLMDLELTCEKEVCYINPYISEVIARIRNNTDLKIILVSDMYLKQEVIVEILICNGFDMRLIDGVFVSSTYNVSKKTQGLFKIVLNEMQISPVEMIHIGDNIASDIKPAIALGIKSKLYGVISTADQKFPYLNLEKLKYGDICSELFSLRNLSASYNSYQDEKAEWYNLGTMILGPVFAGFAEWMLDQAEENGINQIFPIMREGKFLTELLKAANKYRDNKICINPIFASRKAVYSAILNIIEKRDIKIIMNSDLLKLKDVLSILNIEELLPIELKEFKEIDIGAAKKLKSKDGKLYQQIERWLTSDEVIKAVREKNKDSDVLMMKYIEKLGMFEPYITSDIGWRGSMPDGIQRILLNNGKKVKNINLLMFGRLDALPNVFDNCDIRGYVGSFGRNLDVIREIFVRVFECFVICDAGTTSGYTLEKGKVIPVIKNVNYSDNLQFANIMICQEGILAYQNMYLNLKKVKPTVAVSEKKPEDLCKLMGRILTMPIYEEALRLGNLCFDQNMGIDKVRGIISEEVLENYREKSLYEFFANGYDREVEWFSGMNVLKNPFYYFDLYYRAHNIYFELKIIHYIERIIKESEKKFVVVGAGGVGRKILKYFSIIGQKDRIESFADNDKIMQKIKLYGKDIKAFDADFETDEFIIGTLDKELADDLSENLKNVRGKDVKYYSYFSN